MVLLLVFWFQSILGDQNVLDKNYSDRLTKPNNQQSSRQQTNKVYHATVSTDPTHATLRATEPSLKSHTSHKVTHVNCLQQTFIQLVLCSFLSQLRNFNSKTYQTIYCLI